MRPAPRPARVVLPSVPEVELLVPCMGCQVFPVCSDGFCAFDFASLIIKGKKLAKSGQCVSLFYHDLWVRATVFTKCFKMCQKILVIQLITGHVNVNSLFKDTHGFERDRQTDESVTHWSVVCIFQPHSQSRQIDLDPLISAFPKLRL